MLLDATDIERTMLLGMYFNYVGSLALLIICGLRVNVLSYESHEHQSGKLLHLGHQRNKTA